MLTPALRIRISISNRFRLPLPGVAKLNLEGLALSLVSASGSERGPQSVLTTKALGTSAIRVIGAKS